MFVFDFESKHRVEKTLITESRGGSGGESHSDTAMIIF